MATDAGIPDNPIAFPHFVPDGHYNGSLHYEGMSLRDWFAGQVMGFALVHAISDERSPMRDHNLPEEWAAQIAYSAADAMLAARAQVRS